MGDNTTLAVLSGRPTIREYAQGVAQDSIGEIAEFIAPSVDTAKHTGKFKVYDKESRFKIPETLRGLGGEATVLGFDRGDANFNADPHALDTPLDNIEIDEAEGEDLLREAADDSAMLGGLAHEDKVITKATGALTPVASRGVWSTDVNPVDELIEQIIAVAKACACGSMTSIGVLFDPNALRAFFANAKTKAYFPGIDSIAPTEENVRKVLLGRNLDIRTTWIVKDTTAKGKASSLDFLLANKVLIFARTKSPTRRSPDFMKTFRPRGRWMVPGVYEKADRRGEVVKLDWSEDVQITNSDAAKLLAIS